MDKMNFQIFYMQILCFGLLLLAANFGGKLTRRLHVGEVVGQVIGGLVVGPVLLFFLEHKVPSYRAALQSLHFLTFIFLSLIAFGIGDELRLNKLRKVGKDALIICFIQALTTWLLVSLVFFLLGFKPIIALIIGSISIATAPAATFVIMNKFDIAGKMRSMLGGIVVVDDVIQIFVFSVLAQMAILFQKHLKYSWEGLILPATIETGLAILLGVGIFLAIRLTVSRRWLLVKNGRSRLLGPEFLSRLISEMPGPSMEILIIVWGFVTFGIGLALHWNIPFLVTAVAAGFLVSNFHSQFVFESLRIENATTMYTLIFFALVGANASIEAFHPENYLLIGAYVLARTVAKVGGTWIGCKITRQDRRLTHSLPRLMLPQAGVAVVTAFFIAAVLGEEGETILGIILPGIIIFEVIGVFASERALMKWRSWTTGGGELIGDEERIRELIEKEKISIYRLIPPECLRVPFDVHSKGEAIWELIRTLQSAGLVRNPGDVLELILQRERQGGTTIGEGISILHGRLPEIREPVVALGVLPAGQYIEFGGPGEILIDIVYMVLSPADQPDLHLQVLAAIAKFLSDSDVRTRLRYAKSELEAMKIIREHSEGQPSGEPEAEIVQK
jgi:Kef-type K+ transport system membrane component KefB/mannitol/fructose-specific phosphotransferase system IIA component (Ntr-type)